MVPSTYLVIFPGTRCNNQTRFSITRQVTGYPSIIEKRLFVLLLKYKKTKMRNQL